MYIGARIGLLEGRMTWTPVRTGAAAVVVLAIIFNLVLAVAQPEGDLIWEAGPILLVLGMIAAVYLIYGFVRGRRIRTHE